jgi:8-oxo-dGTP diphosphatase
MTTIWLIRHAKAGARDAWTGDDDDRPLSKAGQHQADRLVRALEAKPVRVLSSPAVRCVQTVEPLAASVGLPVETRRELAEGADAQVALDILLALDEDVVACTHGDVIVGIVERLESDGVGEADPALAKKSSTWVLQIERGRVVEARYAPPS